MPLCLEDHHGLLRVGLAAVRHEEVVPVEGRLLGARLLVEGLGAKKEKERRERWQG